jgi:hypothetical protein
MITLDRDTTLEPFRQAVLEALDKTAREVFAHFPLAARNDTGATDADLPELFKGIDAQVERLCQRYNAIMVEE